MNNPDTTATNQQSNQPISDLVDEQLIDLKKDAHQKVYLYNILISRTGLIT